MLRDIEASTGRTPDALKAFPILDARLQFVFKVFDRLAKGSGYTGLGMGGVIPNPVSASEVFRYCDGIGYHGARRRVELLDLVQCLDQARIARALDSKDGG